MDSNPYQSPQAQSPSRRPFARKYFLWAIALLFVGFVAFVVGSDAEMKAEIERQPIWAIRIGAAFRWAGLAAFIMGTICFVALVALNVNRWFASLRSRDLPRRGRFDRG